MKELSFENDINQRDIVYWEHRSLCRLYNKITPDSIEIMHRLEFDELSLEIGTWDDLSFLQAFNGKIKIISINTSKVDWQGLHHCDLVEQLIFPDVMKNTIDFSIFKNLKRLWIDGREKNIEQVLSLTSLQDLRIANWQGSDLSALRQLTNLVCLELVDARKLQSLDGIGVLEKLHQLQLVCCSKLADISELTTLCSLQMLQIDSCKKIEFAADYAMLENLKYLCIWGQKQLVSLQPFMRCNALEILKVSDLRVLDGQVACIQQLPNLKKLILQQKKDYDADLSAFEQSLEAKFGDYIIQEKYFQQG
ncbi:hypothetical protein ORJ04_20110 [Rheinheimera baltica]|uniref:Internalin-A n=1 Tax=Rheinheimera baltica TaxID=67576 RepID=A0ABT9I4E6_9GAMM|nr:hypothetical protein [Rheinheimera baltica]MDP5138257.1 hypothetical protein [Rheinheimera baltica]MDP5148606.1 hypothetical protein [Rheinheimera baltica]